MVSRVFPAFSPAILSALACLALGCEPSAPSIDGGPAPLDAGQPDARDAAIATPDAGATSSDAGGPECAVGETRRCYRGPAGTEGRGLCRAGVERCIRGVWDGECAGQVLPARSEVCGNLEDDTCEGDVDEGCGECAPGEARPCYPGPVGTEGIGRCRAGAQTCTAARTWDPTCEGSVVPRATESCNAEDDDCDGALDESFGNATCGVGACERTVARCAAGLEQSCTEGAPADETCNAIDDDCDGRTDEGLGAQRCGVGACAREVSACTGGAVPTCMPGAPARESCNGADDDCDGRTDEELGPLRCGRGLCAREVSACRDGLPAMCVPGAPSPEICNGFDEDCDGTADDAPLGEGEACDTGRPGICASGSRRCGAAVLRCVPTLSPRAESCNALDDDCDGSVDEQRRAETCDRMDDDCDGRIDEEPTNGTLLYADCDRDGRTSLGAASVRVCTGQPIPAPPTCAGGTFVASSPGADCNDQEPDAFVGQTRSFARPMSAPTSSGSRWDYDCDGVDEPLWIESRTACGTLAGCTGGGWDQPSVPVCGESARWRACAPSVDGTRCASTLSERTQQCL